MTSVAAFGARYQFTAPGDGIEARLQTSALASAQRNSGPQDMEVELTVPGMDLEESENGFSQIRVKGLFPLDRAGHPELFSTGTLLSVPEGFEPHIEVVDSHSTTLDHVRIQPVQQRFRCSTGRESVSYNAQTYASLTPFPARNVRLEEVGKMGSVRLVRLALYPFQTVGGDERLIVTSKIRVRVTFKGTASRTGQAVSPTFYRLARAATANGMYLGDSLRARQGAERLLILTADSLKSSLGELVAWKQSKGLMVKVVTLTEAGGTKEAMQTYIENEYKDVSTRPTYLLFVGDRTSMPAFKESTGSGDAISDFRMATLEGNDDIPDAFYGRILAQDASEVALQVSRMIQYEKSPTAGFWYPNGATIASNEGSNPSDAEYAEMAADALKAYTYRSVDAFTQGGGNAKPANIQDAVNTGRSWVAYWGHGSGTSWGSTNGSFANRHVDQLTNGGRLPVVIDVACQNGNWGSISRPFGKAWVTATDGGQNSGAVAFYGGSVNISWHPPAVMSVGVAKYHFEKPVHHLGGSVLAGQLYLVEKMGTGKNVTDNIKWYNLFGDPSMLIRTDVPKAYRLKHQVRKTPRAVMVEVSAVNSLGAGMSGVLTSLTSQNGDPLAVAKTDATGKAVLKVSGVSQLGPNTQLTATGYNLETQQIAVR